MTESPTLARRDELPRAIGELGEGRPSADQMRRVVTLVGSSARTAGARAVASGRWLADVSAEAATHLPIRDAATLAEHHRSLEGALLAGALVRNASLTTATVGGITGALAAASELTPTTWALLPVELAAETLVVVAIEMKLVAELHTAAGRPIEGTRSQVGAALVRAWAESRGVEARDLFKIHKGRLLQTETRSQLAAALRRRIMVRAGRNLGSFVPFLVGAAAGGELNRRATRALGTKVSASLGLTLPR